MTSNSYPLSTCYFHLHHVASVLIANGGFEKHDNSELIVVAELLWLSQIVNMKAGVRESGSLDEQITR